MSRSRITRFWWSEGGQRTGTWHKGRGAMHAQAFGMDPAESPTIAFLAD